MTEKKITAIYAALDSGNFSEAAKLCMKPGMSTNPLAQALLSYAYAAMKRHDEALTIARQILQSPVAADETIVSTLAHTFKVCKADDEAVKMYEVALAAHPPQSPSYEHLSQDLFASLIRIGDFKRMQLLAQKMIKSLDSNVYAFWSVCSMLLQGDDLPSAMLVVAEKMVRKVLSDEVKGSVEPSAIFTREKLCLTADIFERQGKDTEALLLFDEILGPFGEKLAAHPSKLSTSPDATDYAITPTLLEYLSVRLQILQSIMESKYIQEENSSEIGSGLYDNSSKVRLAIVDTVEVILISHPDQWDAHWQYLQLFDKEKRFETPLCWEGVQHSVDGRRSIDEEERAVLARRCRSFLLNLRENNGHLRGPCLALLYLQMLLRDDFPTDELPKLSELLLVYINKFSDKQCCFSDVKPLLSHMADGELLSLLSPLISLYREITTKINSIIHDEPKPSESLPAPPADTDTSGSSKAPSKKSKSKSKGKVGQTPKPPPLPQEVLVTFVNAHNAVSLSHAAVSLSCQLTKLIQIISQTVFIVQRKDRHEHESVDVSDVFRLFKRCQSLCSRGIGDSREAQPADDLWLVICSAYRQRYVSIPQSDKASRLGWAMRWLSVTRVGLDKCRNGGGGALRALILEPLREVGASRLSLDAFKAMGTKFIQADTLSYLVYPNLVEIHKCFTCGNYSKAIELQRFISLCARSTQWALSRTEGVLFQLVVDLTTSSYSAERLRKTLDEVTAVKDDLVDHMDYSLHVRCDSDSALESHERRQRSEAYRARVRIAKAIASALVGLLAEDIRIDDATASIQEKCADIDPISFLARELHVLTEADSTSLHMNKVDLVDNYRGPYFPWDQRLWRHAPKESLRVIDVLVVSLMRLSDAVRRGDQGRTDELTAGFLNYLSQLRNDIVFDNILEFASLVHYMERSLPWTQLVSAFLARFLVVQSSLAVSPTYRLHPNFQSIMREVVRLLVDLGSMLTEHTSKLTDLSRGDVSAEKDCSSCIEPLHSTFLSLESSVGDYSTEVRNCESQLRLSVIDSHRQTAEQLLRHIDRHRHILQDI